MRIRIYQFELTKRGSRHSWYALLRNSRTKKKKKEEPEHNVFGRCGVKNLSAIAGSLVSVDGIHFCKQFWVPHLIHQVSSSQLSGAARSTSRRRCCKVWPRPPGFTKSLAKALLRSSSSGVARGSIERRYFAKVSSSEGTGSFGRVCCNESVAMVNVGGRGGRID